MYFSLYLSYESKLELFQSPYLMLEKIRILFHDFILYHINRKEYYSLNSMQTIIKVEVKTLLVQNLISFFSSKQIFVVGRFFFFHHFKEVAELHLLGDDIVQELHRVFSLKQTKNKILFYIWFEYCWNGFFDEQSLR